MLWRKTGRNVPRPLRPILREQIEAYLSMKPAPTFEETFTLDRRGGEVSIIRTATSDNSDQQTWKKTDKKFGELHVEWTVRNAKGATFEEIASADNPDDFDLAEQIKQRVGAFRRQMQWSRRRGRPAR